MTAHQPRAVTATGEPRRAVAGAALAYPARDDEAARAASASLAAAKLERMHPSQAIAALEAAYELAPDDVRTSEALTQAYESLSQWDRAFTLRRQRLERLGDGGQRAASLAEVTRHACATGTHLKRVIELWEVIEQLEPAQLETLTTLGSLYERSCDWRQLIRVAQQLHQAGAAHDVRIQWLQKAAMAAEKMISDLELAARLWHELLSLDRENRVAYQALKRIHASRAEWQELEGVCLMRGELDECVRLLEEGAKGVAADQRADLSCRIGLLHMQHGAGARTSQAIRMFESARALEPRHLVAARALSELYDPARDPVNLIGVLEVLAADSEEPAAMLGYLGRLAQIAEEEGELGTAVRARLRAFQLACDDRAVRREAGRLTARAGDWRQLVRLYDQAIAGRERALRATVGGEWPSLLVELAHIHEIHLGDPATAVEVFERLVTTADDEAEALALVEGLEWSSARYHALAGLLRRRIDTLGDPASRLPLLYRLAETCIRQLGDEAQAAAVFREILAVSQRELPALRGLVGLLERNGAFEELAALVADHARALVDAGLGEPAALEAYVECAARAAEVYEVHLANPSAALRWHAEVLRFAHDRGATLDAVESYLSANSHRVQAARLLVAVLPEDAGPRARVLAEACGVLASACHDPAERAALSSRSASLWHQAGEPRRAFEALGHAIAADPSNLSLVLAAEDLARETRAWSDLAQAYREALGQALPLDTQVELRLRLARVYGDELGEIDRAILTYRRVLDIAPRPIVIERLLALLEREQRQAELDEELATWAPPCATHERREA